MRARSSRSSGEVEFAIAGERCGEAGFSRAHSVALAGDRERRSTGAPNVARDQGKIIDSSDSDRALCRMVDSHRPSYEGGARAAVDDARLQDLFFSWRPVIAETCCGCKRGDELCERLEAGGIASDIVAIDEIFADKDVGDAIEESDIGTWLSGQVNVGHHRRLGDPGIYNDERARLRSR